MKPTILLDFDGTLGLGNGPVTAYARAISSRAGGEEFFSRACSAIVAFEAGEADYLDGYHAVAKIAETAGISAEIRSAAYRSSREVLGTNEAPVGPPAGLNDFFQGIRGRARLVVASNAPGSGILRLLQEWGVLALIEATHFAVGKPDGLLPIVQEALELGPVLSVGDIYAFDLAPAASLGASTALVGPTSQFSPSQTTMRGRSLDNLYPQITDWVDRARKTAL